MTTNRLITAMAVCTSAALLTVGVMLATIMQILDSAVRLMTPLLLACLAGLFSERSGIFDIGLEGKMLIAAFAAGAAGAIPGVPVVDTIKVVDAGGVITATPLRDSLRAVQTPQGFDRTVLAAAHAAGAAATDDAAMVEALGHDVLVVEGDERALKVTTPADLTRAEQLLR